MLLTKTSLFRLISALLLLIVSLSHTNAGGPAISPLTKPILQSQTFLNSAKDFAFTQNQGQLADENGQLLTDIHYYGHQNGVYLYCRSNKLSFVFTKSTEEKPDDKDSNQAMLVPEKFRTSGKTTIETSRMDLNFLHANPSPEIISENATESYTNYYLAHTPEEGITHVQSFKKLTYRNLYPSIDLVLLCNEKGLEYEFLLHSGGKVSDIQIQWEGTETMLPSPEGGIRYTTRLGEMNESGLASFTASGTVKSRYLIHDNIVGFEVGNFDMGETLVIDPALVWGTYFGGEGPDFANAIEISDSNFAFITGYSYRLLGIGTTGAFNYHKNGDYDVFIAKFTETNQLLWATYFGGKEWEVGSGLCLDKYFEVFITGTTRSSTGITTSGSYQTRFGGSRDAFLAKFSTTGSLLWSTYFGGYGDDFEYGGIKTDNSGSVYITGETNSDSYIATSGAYQTSRNSTDAFLSKFSGSGQIKWATYFGGNYIDEANNLTIDTSGNIYIAGQTSSTSGLATNGAYQTGLTSGSSSSQDAFIAKFSPNGMPVWSSYFGGELKENTSSIAMDKSGHVCLFGLTQSKTKIASPGVFRTSISGTQDAFIARFSSAGAMIWATYYGGASIDYSGGLCTDSLNNIYISGTTSTLKGIDTSSGFQNSFGGGNYDIYVAKLDSSGKHGWSSYYGGSGDDYSLGIAIRKPSDLYITGYSTGFIGISTPGSFKEYHNKDYNDAIVAKISILPNCPFKPIIIGDTIVCAQRDNIYKVSPHPGFSYLWSVSGGKIKSGINSDSITVTWDTVASGKLRILEYSQACTNTSAIMTPQINPSPYTSKIQKIKLAAHDYIFFTNDTTFLSYHWQFGDGTDSISTYHIFHSYIKDSIYKVSLQGMNINSCGTNQDTFIEVFTCSDNRFGIQLPMVHVSPNPFTQSISISYSLLTTTNIQITLTDLSGKEIPILKSTKQTTGNYNYELNAKDYNLSEGVYLLKIQMEDKLITRQLVHLKE